MSNQTKVETPPFGVLPETGTVWCWEPLKDHARELVAVMDVHWNGEEWWVVSVKLTPDHRLPGFPWALDEHRHPNSLDRWIEATVFVASSVDEMNAEVAR